MAAPTTRIAIIAGTGKSGKWALKAALLRGYKIKLLARSPEKVDTVLKEVFANYDEAVVTKLKEDSELKIVKGGINDTAVLVDLFTGCDVVMSFLGMLPDQKPVVGPGVESILKALDSMEKGAQPKKFLHMSSIALSESHAQAKKAWGGCVTCCVLKVALKKCFADMQVAEDIIETHREKQSPDSTKVTICRATVLGDKKNYFRDLLEKPTEEDKMSYLLCKVGEEKGKKLTMNIDRQHVGEAFLDLCEIDIYDGGNVSIFDNVKVKKPKEEEVEKVNFDTVAAEKKQ